MFALDPINIILGNSGTTSAGTIGTIDGSGSGPGTLNVNVNAAFQNITAGQILLEASGDITLNAGTTWNLYSSTGYKTSGQLTLEAGGDILFGNNSRITDVNNANPAALNSWAVTLYAGFDFVNQVVQSGSGNIYLNGNSGGETEDLFPEDYYMAAVRKAYGKIDLRFNAEEKQIPNIIDRLTALAPWPVRFIDPAPAIARRALELMGSGTPAGPQPAAKGQILFTSGRPPSPALAAALSGFGLGETAPNSGRQAAV